PWVLRHFENLRVYYLEYGPDVGTSVSLVEVARFNWIHFQSAFGLAAALGLIAGLSVCAINQRFHPARALLVGLCWAAPLAILIGTKSTGNIYVQQAALGIPALFFAAWQSRG